ncbi:MAG: HlyD family type I secretion periplasmic adaptor subunit [Gammaproteobacteria bacterium]|nr:HlyD family type I secretion periplasmic adaptor subunit [Gammaproteobacteria bacterium]MDH3560101.1 HlyD family type I secretion periplasmic adaptor subunit [Gammaproteobacteria bacterium]
MTSKLRNRLTARNHTIDDAELARLRRDDAGFISDVNAAVLIGASRSSHLILATTALFFFVALIWAANANLDEVTRGEGKVIPSDKIQVIQNLEGGILSEILVEEGELVEKGQPLLRLDDTRFSSTYRETWLKYLDLLAKSARLKAEAQGKPLQMPEQVWKEHEGLARNEVALFESRSNELDSNLGILKEQEGQTRQELAELHARKDKIARSYALLKQELDMSAPLAAEGAISEVEILRLKRSANDLRGELEGTQLAIPRLESVLEEMGSKIEDLEISFRTQARSELNEVEAELSGVEEALHSQEDRVSRTLVRSPVRGAVKQIKVATIGGVIQPGMDLLEIVPLEGTLLVEAHVRPADIAFLRPDQVAQVKLTAYDYAIYGGIPAKLEHISADTITDERGDSFFLIKVRTDRNYLGPEGNPLKIIPGMTAVVDVMTGKKTVLDYLLKPVLRAREMALREK